MRKLLFYLTVGALITACAPAQQGNETKQISQFKNDFTSGLNVVFDYVTDNRRTWIMVDIENPEGTNLQAWLVQKNETAGRWTASGKRFHTGNDKIVTQTFRVPIGQPGTAETFVVEVFDQNGGLLMVTEPITNTFKEETP